jgi:MFS family permease
MCLQVCFFYALGPSLLDIFLSPMCKQMYECSVHACLCFFILAPYLACLGRVKKMLRSWQWSDEGPAFAYLYALTLSAYAFSKCVSAPFVGYLSDKLGRRKTLTFTLLATGMMLILTCRCQSWTALIVCRFVTGLFSNGGLLTAYAADIATSLRDRTTLFSYFITAWAFARVAAAYIFPLVGEDINVCCLCALVCEVFVDFTSLFPPPHRPQHACLFEITPSRWLRRFLRACLPNQKYRWAKLSPVGECRPVLS